MRTESYGVKIAGVGAYAPPRIVTNDDIADRLRREGEPVLAKLGRPPTKKESRVFETNDEWIRKYIGFSQRRFVEEGQGTIDLAIPAAKLALEAARVNPSEVNALYFATVTPSYLNSPPDAALLQEALGIPTFVDGHPRETFGNDSSLACCSWAAAFRSAYHSFLAGDAEVALLIGADAMSTTINWRDRAFACVLGDAGTATVLQRTRRAEDWCQPNWMWSWLDGSRAKVITTPKGGSRQPIQSADDLGTYQHRLGMDGAKVREDMVPFIGRQALGAALSKAGLTIDQLDFAILHEANLVLNGEIVKAWREEGFRGEVFSAEGMFSNTTSATVALSLALNAGKIRPGHLGALVVFGGGYSCVILFIRAGEAIPALLQV